jgi:hypothetical protein
MIDVCARGSTLTYVPVGGDCLISRTGSIALFPRGLILPYGLAAARVSKPTVVQYTLYFRYL